ncbi:hypothetical protein ACI6PS_15750 [Flavobacterium sp. PLA-1-15]|uniref:hypothetical protein n=1 Tax=Flavobacterium sp. PLA-1-15 TaxID=3380533 RepID=UPI003B796B24
MNIELLINLRDNPLEYGSEENFRNEGIPISEIVQLEQTWNNGNLFPIALRELLYLGGKFCYVLDTGWYDTQQEMQDAAREWLTENSRTISRPFYVIDIYNAGEQFLMIYLDEGDNPNVYNVYLPNWRDDQISWLSSTGMTLKDFINFRINKVIKGFNPF